MKQTLLSLKVENSPVILPMLPYW